MKNSPPHITQPQKIHHPSVRIVSYHTPLMRETPSSACYGYLPRLRFMRQSLCHDLGLTSVQWLQQVHGKQVIHAQYSDSKPQADGSFTHQSGLALSVATADCLPVILYSKTQPWIAAVHAGWRGLYQDIITQARSKYPGDPRDLCAWIGPHISQDCYQVDKAFVDRFNQKDSFYSECFIPVGKRFQANLARIAMYQLHKLGLNPNFIEHANLCTMKNAHLPSYRQDAYRAGRILSLCWLT